MAEGQFHIRWDVVTIVVSWIVGGLIAYGALEARIRVLESQYDALTIRYAEDIRELKTDVKTLLRRSAP